ncbi:MAG: HlyD family efflux transporter periplasmic adaptor subunit [Parachlamydia sp.]|jgi:multidrug efflux pump subunit AcrA (membrane-fusion protein)|nr:HlyD family efflux transporter periplasmic adaptor subunit [Parachlamydia sp.]
MKRTYFYLLAGLALAFLVLIFFMLLNQGSAPPPVSKSETHSISPFPSSISALGVVKAGSENIMIGTPVNRLVQTIFVSVGDTVVRGDPLFKLDDRDLEADLRTQKTAYEIAVAELKKLEVLPRPEDLFTAEADLQNAAIEKEQTERRYNLTQRLSDPRALSQDDISKRFATYKQAEAKWEQAKAHLSKVKAGTWEPDLEIAELKVQQAKNQVMKVLTEIDRMNVRSPIDGKVLQIKIHEGELPTISNTPLMVIGNIEEKKLEVSINQFNASNFNPKASAVAYLQGDSSHEYPLEFVKLEPYLVSKQHVASNLAEKVDTRVLQVTYRFKDTPSNLYVGQVMDVFIDTSKDHGHEP